MVAVCVLFEAQAASGASSAPRCSADAVPAIKTKASAKPRAIMDMRCAPRS